jgi:uncharacterized membrane protein
MKLRPATAENERTMPNEDDNPTESKPAQAKRPKLLTRMRKNIRNRLVSGVLVLMPIGITLLIIRWLAGLMADILRKPINQLFTHLGWRGFLGRYPDAAVYAISILALLVLLYFVGVLARYVLGRKVIDLIEHILMKIPFVKAIYGASRQVVQAISLPDRSAFKAVVALEFPAPGMRTLGFITGTITDPDGKLHYKVFIPTTPNVTTGFFEIVPEDKLYFTNFSVEGAFKTIISGGILAPDKFLRGQPVRSHQQQEMPENAGDQPPEPSA